MIDRLHDIVNCSILKLKGKFSELRVNLVNHSLWYKI